MNWKEALRATWKVHMGPVEFGTNDCCQLIRTYARTLSGKDYGAKFDYATEREARQLLIEHGGLQGLLESVLGPPKETAEPGDVVVANLADQGTGAGVWTGQWVVAVLEGYGIVRHKGDVVAAWHV